MSIVVGFGPDVPTTSGLRLAGLLARAAGTSLVLCCVVHDALAVPSLRDSASVDAEWQAHLRADAEEAITTARSVLPEDLETETVLRSGRSVPQVLREEGEARRADLLVVGPASLGNLGRITLGSTTSRLLHGSSIPVALAPRGYPGTTGPRRLVFAMEPSHADVDLVDRVAAQARMLGVPVRVVTFLVRPGTAAGAVYAADVLSQWLGLVEEAQERVRAGLEAVGVPASSAGVVEGDRWSSAVQDAAWQEGDLLITGSSAHGPVASVFLGSTAARIMRHAPVPMIVLPR